MAYGIEDHEGHPSYEVILEHPQTGIQARVIVMANHGDVMPSENPSVDEAQRDALFQEVLSAMNALGVMTVVSATKRGNYVIPVTP